MFGNRVRRDYHTAAYFKFVGRFSWLQARAIDGVYAAAVPAEKFFDRTIF